jgi:hypothetical protein
MMFIAPHAMAREGKNMPGDVCTIPEDKDKPRLRKHEEEDDYF